MKAVLAATALITLTSSFAIAATTFDCATLSDTQVQKIEHDMSSDSLKDLAKTCDEQASTFQKIAQDGQKSLPNQDISELYEKAANAHMRVAMFTNDALMK